jgi:hypothetical protein
MFGYRRRPKAARKPDPHRHVRERANHLAALHGIEIEKEANDAFWVTHPKLQDTDHDPLDGNHFAADWAEVLDAVQVYVDYLADNPEAA